MISNFDLSRSSFRVKHHALNDHEVLPPNPPIGGVRGVGGTSNQPP